MSTTAQTRIQPWADRVVIKVLDESQPLRALDMDVDGGGRCRAGTQ